MKIESPPGEIDIRQQQQTAVNFSQRQQQAAVNMCGGRRFREGWKINQLLKIHIIREKNILHRIYISATDNGNWTILKSRLIVTLKKE